MLAQIGGDLSPLCRARWKEEMADPRVFFAAERTLLAWIRTGLTVIGLGFVVARFGLFLSLLSASPRVPEGGIHAPAISNAIGVALAALGACAILGALRNHQEYLKSIPPEDLPRRPLPWLATILAASISAAGIVLAVYLAIV